MVDLNNICLASQRVRELISSGKITVPCFNESNIQPASIDLTLGNEVYILDVESVGIFRPKQDETVRSALNKLHPRQRKKEYITGGFELKKGFMYLVPLNESITITDGEYIKSSPKSSLGRLFVHTRMLVDFNPCFDEASYHYKKDSKLNMWILISPLAFNIVVYPGLSLNQMRIFMGEDCKLSSSDIVSEFKAHPFMLDKNGTDLVPVRPIINDGFQIHLDLSGKTSNGVIGLRARHNPTPIDLKRIGEYEIDDFFEALKGAGELLVQKGENYLLVSKEVLDIPLHLSAELKSHSHIGLSGYLHFAGFIDNGFRGELVFEVRSEEAANILLTDGMPISKLDLFKSEPSDKPYSKNIGSHYWGQSGIKVAKYFRSD